MTTPAWRFPAEIEKPFRDALNHASKRRVSELHGLLRGLTDEQLAAVIGLCGMAVAYTAIDVTGRRWPADAELRRIAQGVTKAENPDEQYGVTEQNLYLFLSEVALGFKPYVEVFEGVFQDPSAFFSAPFFFAINVLARFRPAETAYGDFLEQIEDAYEKAWLLDLDLLPALMVRARMPQAAQAPDADRASS